MQLKDNLYKIKYEEFENGKDKIYGTVCADMGEYWHKFISQVIYGKLKNMI